MAKTKFIDSMGPEERSEYFRAIRRKVKKPTGFAAMDKDKLKAISSLGGQARQTKQGGESGTPQEAQTPQDT